MSILKSLPIIFMTYRENKIKETKNDFKILY